MKVLGLTGDIACGKSSAARILADFGAAALDSDQLVRDLYADPGFAARVQALFEAEIRDDNGQIDRAKLGELVLDDVQALGALESLVHPAVAGLRAQRLEKLAAAGQKVVTVEAVKLLESGQGAVCDEVWCVVCAPDVQLRRLRQNRGLSEPQARLRLQNQPSRARKQLLAGDVPLIWLENNGSLDELRATLQREWTRFLA